MIKSKSFRSRAPVRVDFTGGYTDISPFTNNHTGKSVNAAITLFTYVDGVLRSNKKITIFSKDTGTRIEAESLNKLKFDGKLDIVKGILFEFPIPQGVDITIKSDAPLGSGLGTSASLGVATLGLINKLTNCKKSKLEIAELAASVERKVGIAGGRQDQYASTFGGIQMLEFPGNNSKIVKLSLKKQQIKFLEDHLLLIHTHGTRDSGNLVEQIMDDYKQGKENVKIHLEHLNELAPLIYEALSRPDIYRLSKLIREVHTHQCGLHKDIIDNRTNNILSRFAQIGIVAGKQLGGAGSGSCVIFICEPSLRTKAQGTLTELGCYQLPFSFDMAGLKVFELYK